jgi:hypothetical protein
MRAKVGADIRPKSPRDQGGRLLELGFPIEGSL